MQTDTITRRSWLGTAAALACPWPVGARGAHDTYRGLRGTAVRFASVAEGRALLEADDEWMRATSAFQRRAVMGRADEVTLDEFRRWNGDAVQPWPEAQREHWRRLLDEASPALARLRIPLPPEVWLVATNGQESAQAPYTRTRAVAITAGAMRPDRADASLLVHELWHVAARHAPSLASRLYAELGFEPMPPLRMPAAWAPMVIANPDAPRHEHAMPLSIDGRPVRVAPVLVARRSVLRPGESFFSVTDVRLLEVEPDGDGFSRGVLRDGEPAWHRPDGEHAYLQRLGGNTGYVIHPEETLADNIALLATGRPARNPALLERLRQVLVER